MGDIGVVQRKKRQLQQIAALHRPIRTPKSRYAAPLNSSQKIRLTKINLILQRVYIEYPPIYNIIKSHGPLL